MPHYSRENMSHFPLANWLGGPHSELNVVANIGALPEIKPRSFTPCIIALLTKIFLFILMLFRY
jgi:hypothetical protein